MKVYWTLEARARLVEIHTYIAKKSPMVARDVTARILRRARQLAVPPLLGRRLPEYPHADLRELMEHPFRIIYVVKPDRVEDCYDQTLSAEFATQPAATRIASASMK